MHSYSNRIRRVSALLVVLLALVAVVPQAARASEVVFQEVGGHGHSVVVMASGGWLDVYDRVTYGMQICASWISEHGPVAQGVNWTYLGANDCVYVSTWSQYGAGLQVTRGTHTYGPGGPKITVYQP